MARTVKVGGEEQIDVHEVTKVHVSALNPSPYNPRSITPAMLESLKENIKRFGFVSPVVVQEQSEKYGSSIIIGGHQRVRALREICIEDNVAIPPIPAVVLRVDDRGAKILNIALNKIDGDFDARLLGEVLEDLHASRPIADDEVKVLGLEDDELRRFLKLADPPKFEEPDAPTFGSSVTLSLSFTDVKKRDAVKAKLEELAKASEKSTGDVVLGLLERKKR
jgi:ParB-like chromosome segregation protein Spo0J